MSAAYRDFLERKVCVASTHGFDVDAGDVNPRLRPHARAIVPWLLRGGRRALFASFGLAKTTIQLETVRLAAEHAGGRGLITVPLGVRQEFARDAVEVLGWPEPPRFIRSIDEAEERGVYLTNYETVRDGKLDPRLFAASSLDEASVLRGFGGTKTFREFMRLYAGDGKTMNERVRSEGVRYRFVATATPSPNDYIELLAYAAYLGIMDVSAAKTRFFKRNSEKADTLTIHPHKETEFWLWVSTWALFITKPSDLGPEFSDEGYELPELDVRWHEVPTDHRDAGAEKDGQARMFRNAAIGVTDAAREKRDSLESRVAKVLEIVRDGRRAETIVPTELLRGEPGAVADGAAGARPPQLPREAGPVSQAHAEGAAQGVRADDERLSGHPRRSTRSMRDLRSGSEAEAPPLRGSRSRDGGGAGASLQPLQSSDRPAQRRSGLAHSSSGLPDQLIVWCDLNDEQRRLGAALLSEGISVSSLEGSQSIEERDELLEAWRTRETSAFLSKPVMYGAGVNLQQCHTMIFAGISFKAQDMIQAVHRIHRFMQEHRCTVHFIYTEAERDVRRRLEEKWANHNAMVARMIEIIREHGLAHAGKVQELTRALGVSRAEASGTGYRCINNDCVLELDNVEPDSVGLVLTSIPFSTQYEYSPNYADFGHTDTNAHFFEQMDFLTPKLLRVLQPGRIAAVHVKDRVVPGGLKGLGFQTVYRFSDKTADHFEKHGFEFLSRKTIVTDVVRENNQTYRLGWTEQCKDATKMGAGMPEYLMLFRKPPTDNSRSYADAPVVKSKDSYTRARWQFDAHGFMRSSGNRRLRPEELEGLEQQAIFKLFRQHSLERIYDFEHDVKLAEHVDARGWLPSTFMLLQPQSTHPDVWTDITRMRTLNGMQSAKGKEMHLCPLQLDLCDRVIAQLSNVGDVVLDPFAGLMTVPERAVRLKRRGVGIELSAPYFLDGSAYCEAAERDMTMPTLFDLLEKEEDAA